MFACLPQLPAVVVVETTPLPALGIPVEKYAGNVQSVTAEEITAQNLLTMPDQLYRNVGSFNLNDTQGDPWQTDLTYRGFLASPFTGGPIGLSMYLDGMRFNNGFGDTINWDLIPESAIAGITISRLQRHRRRRLARSVRPAPCASFSPRRDGSAATPMPS